jgi:AcrR family transcriptional regulator
MIKGTKKRALTEKQKSDKKVLAIAAAAAKFFSAKGYVETSMEDIAAAAKISKGGMYHYFGSKCDILYFISSTFMDFVLHNMQQDLEKVEDPEERLRLIIFTHVKTYSEHMYMAKTILNEAHNLPSPRLKEIKSKEKKYYDAIAGTLSSYIGPTVDKDTLTVLTFSLLAMCNWIFAWYNPKGNISPGRLPQIIFDWFIRSLKTAGSRVGNKDE